MRSIFSLAVLLITAVIVLLLMSHQTRRDLDAVKSVSFAIQPEVRAAAFDRAAANRLADRLRSLLDSPQLPEDELRAAAAQAAAWAAGVVPGTPEYHMAVNLRGAADELLAASESLSDPHRDRARQFLDRALTPPGAPGGGPPGAIGGIRDQLQNLQQRHNEQLQETERERP